MSCSGYNERFNWHDPGLSYQAAFGNIVDYLCYILFMLRQYCIKVWFKIFSNFANLAILENFQ